MSLCVFPKCRGLTGWMSSASEATRQFGRLTVLGLLVMGLAGCAAEPAKIELKPYYGRQSEKIDLVVKLQIPSEMFSYLLVEEFKYLGVPHENEWELGNIFARNARTLSNQVFRGVIAGSSAKAFDAVLVPRVVELRRVPPPRAKQLAWIEVERFVAIEWTLKDKSDRVVVQLVGRGSHKNTSGTAFSSRENAVERFQKAIDNAYADSSRLLHDADELAIYASKIKN